MESRPLIELLAGREFPELAAAVRARIPRIMQRWEDLVREALPKADQLSEPQLRDDAPQVLEQVAKSLESDAPRHTDELVAITANHGVTRFRQNFNLRELLLEYNLLRAVTLDEVANHLARALDVMEIIGANAALDIMIRRSVHAFADFQARELQAATEAQSKYLSFLSHDLRGGLNGVFLMIEVLKRELSNEPRLAETVKDLDAMRRSLMDTVGTMDRFLHAERFRKGKVQLKPQLIRVKQLLNEVVAQFAYQAKDKGLEIKVEATDDCTVTSDRELLSLILQNLLSNAIKYTDAGQVVIRAVSSGDGGCVISVQDQGPGIAAERLCELFAPFTRGETHGQPGVGLGLSIARQAAEYLNARLWADSTPAQGSTFRIQLPSRLPAKGLADDRSH